MTHVTVNPAALWFEVLLAGRSIEPEVIKWCQKLGESIGVVGAAGQVFRGPNWMKKPEDMIRDVCGV